MLIPSFFFAIYKTTTSSLVSINHASNQSPVSQWNDRSQTQGGVYTHGIRVYDIVRAGDPRHGSLKQLDHRHRMSSAHFQRVQTTTCVRAFPARVTEIDGSRDGAPHLEGVTSPRGWRPSMYRLRGRVIQFLGCGPPFLGPVASHHKGVTSSRRWRPSTYKFN